jgi:hypothetical protein
VRGGVAGQGLRGGLAGIDQDPPDGSIVTADIANNAVTDAKLRDSGALSVIGRSANSAGDPADISAVAASGAVFRESGGVLGWGTIATDGIGDAQVTDAKLASQYALLAGRSGGQALIGGTGSGNNLALTSTSHGTKGKIQIGGSTGLVYDEALGTAALGAAPDSTYAWKVTSSADADINVKVVESTSNTRRVFAAFAAAARQMQFRICGSGVAGNTSYGVAQADLVGFEFANISNVAFTGFGTLLLNFSGTNKYTFATSLLTLGDAVDVALNATTGTKIGTATGQKLGQQVLATGAAKVVDDVITLLQTLGLCKQS